MFSAPYNLPVSPLQWLTDQQDELERERRENTRESTRPELGVRGANVEAGPVGQPSRPASWRAPPPAGCVHRRRADGVGEEGPEGAGEAGRRQPGAVLGSGRGGGQHQ